VLAVLGGLGAALSWAATGLFAQRAGRTIGELSTFAWASTLGLGIALIPAVAALSSSAPGSQTLIALALAGVLNVLGLLAQFSALRRGQVSVIVPITSAEGAVAAMFAVAAGARLAPGGWLAFAALIAGVAITAGSQWPRDEKDAGAESLLPVGLAVIAAICFGAGLYFQGTAGADVPLGLAIVPPSFMGAVLVALPMAGTGRLAPPGRARAWLVGVAAAEIIGFTCYVIGARHSVPVAAVLSTQYATIAVLVSVVVLRENLSIAQIVGFGLTIAGVTVLSLVG
jgi:drug/metabolite transporter (DMT)-like permease